MNGEKDGELKDLISSLLPDKEYYRGASLTNSLFGDIVDPSRSKLSDEKRAEIKRLLDAMVQV